ncbi:hypothetical protein L2735_13525 [Shewanella olleyana]|uniref:hypothetical protein n=1 Tax=Shewanella olleyana TaxID=135626 RepID=UPI0020107688|nr:hypothetical protein [Shewanella olleyana]MCL1067813.1 hypothetical protein [Shewanella olleyana]
MFKNQLKSTLFNRLIFCAGLSVSGLTFSAVADNFYANQTLQQQAPQAFALQPQSEAFLAPAYELTIAHADSLLELIAQDKALTNAIKKWPSLTMDEQIPWLKKVFALEVQSFGTEAPQLIIDNHSYPKKMVYFDFDVKAGGNGIVYLNPDKLAEEEAFASLAFLIHETRHSYQFQRAMAGQSDAVSQGYLAAFTAQKQLTGFGFSDFLTLVNEYEAFQFGNYVIGKLTDWQVDMINMGTFASQYDSQGQLKIDLIALSASDAEQSLLSQYNKLAENQYKLRQESNN